MTILVTGAAGFIASHITDALIDRGHKVVILDNLSTGVRDNINPKAEFVEGDITDRLLVEKLFSQHKFDIVNHHAAQLDVRRSVAEPVFDATVNILGTINLLETAKSQGRLKRFMFASTGGAIYGEQDYFPADEQHPTRPMSPYGITKRTAELYMHYYNVVHGLPYVSFRYTNVYGPRQNAHGEAGVVAIFTEKLFNGDTCVINGPGTQTRDYVYVGDLVRAHMLALEGLKEPGAIFNICTGIETDVNQIFGVLSDLTTGGKAKAEHGPTKAGEQQRSVCSYGLIEKTLGWKPEVNLQDGLRETVDYFRQKLGVSSGAESRQSVLQ